MRTGLFAAAFAIAALCAAGSAHAARWFIDNTLGEVTPEQRVQVAEPKPAQMLFQFQTNGAANARAMQFLNPHITQYVTESGAFSAVGAAPADGGAIVSITINNVPQENAASQGFMTGLTFGLRGSVVADYYIATIEYVSGPETAPIRIEVRHTLYTLIGRSEAPPNTTQARNADEAVLTVMRQMVQRLVNDLATQLNAPLAETPAPDAVAADAAAPAADATTTPTEAPAAAEPGN